MSYHAPTRSESPPQRYTLVYDGGCPFCTATSQALQRHSRVPLDLLPCADIAGTGMLTVLSRAEIDASAHFVTPEGVEYHAGEAATRALRLLPGGWLFGVLDLPGLSSLRELGYDLVSRARPLLSRLIHP
jgi:predicted DCC family thiol-disulfide oxidoreductase YuxK